jgi:hypothetical protein
MLRFKSDKEIQELVESLEIGGSKKTDAGKFSRLLREMVEEALTEQVLTEKVNEGDIAEGIFAIACGLHIAYDKIDAGQVEQIRQQIEPALHKGGRQTIEIADMSDLKTKDRIKVVLEIRLKSEKTVGGSFGAEYETASDIPSIARKQTALIGQIEGSSALAKIRKFKEEILNNGRRDAVIFRVIADGLEGESSGGTMKGDVAIQIEASESAEGDLKDIVGAETQSVSFSLKSGSRTIANMSPYHGMLQVTDWFGLGDIFGGGFQEINREAPESRSASKEEKLAAAKGMWQKLQQALVGASGNDEFKNQVFSFLEKSAFGDDKADVVDMGKSGIKEISAANIEAMKNDDSFGITPVISGNYVKFYRTPKEGESIARGDLLYHFRTKLRTTSKGGLELKFYPEVGNLAYNPKKTKK